MFSLLHVSSQAQSNQRHTTDYHLPPGLGRASRPHFAPQNYPTRLASQNVYATLSGRSAIGGFLALRATRHPLLLLRHLCCAPMATPAPAGTPGAIAADEAGQPSSSAVGIDEADWAKLGEYLASYDSKREDLIKQCRDMQKNAKQAIYSLHRGNARRAEQQLALCERVAAALAPTVKVSRAQRNRAPLRHGNSCAR